MWSFFGTPSEESKQEFKKALFSDPEALSTVLAYVMRYSSDYNVDALEILRMLFHLDILQPTDAIGPLDAVGPMYNNKVLKSTLGIDAFLAIRTQLSDNEKDPILESFIAFIAELGLDIPPETVREIWQKTEQKIQVINGSKGIAEYQLPPNKIYDFSSKTYQTLMETIDKIEREGVPSLSSWRGYYTEAWYDELEIESVVRAVDEYDKRLVEINQTSRQRIDEVFENVAEIDKKHAEKLRALNQKLKEVNNGILQLTNAIG